jgi:hypothetical protein
MLRTATEFRRDGHWQVLAIATTVSGLVGLSTVPAPLVWIFAAILPWGLFETYYQWRTPLLVLTGSEVVIRLAWIRPERRIAYAEVAAWAHSYPWITFETIQGRRHHFHYQMLAPEDRERLIAHLESLDLGQSGYDGVTAAEVRRRTWRVRLRTALAMVAFLAATTAFAFWYAYRVVPEGAPPAVPAPELGPSSH